VPIPRHARGSRTLGVDERGVPLSPDTLVLPAPRRRGGDRGARSGHGPDRRRCRQGFSFSATTGEGGVFTFERLPAGRATLQADVIGWIDRGRLDDDVAGSAVTTVTLALNGLGAIDGHRFDGSRTGTATPAGDGASARIGLTPTQPRLSLVAKALTRVRDSRAFHRSRRVAWATPPLAAWRSCRPRTNRAIPPPPSCTGSSATISRPSANTPRRCGMATGFRSLSSKSSVTSCDAAAWPAGSPVFGAPLAGWID
jgi:hypothetical protein